MKEADVVERVFDAVTGFTVPLAAMEDLFIDDITLTVPQVNAEVKPHPDNLPVGHKEESPALPASGKKDPDKVDQP